MDRWIMPRADIAYLDDLLRDANGLPKPVPTRALESVPIGHIQQWCVQRGVYQIVTEELVTWLADQCQGHHAIEICAGFGTIGRALGIPMTDSYMQTRPEIRAQYAMMQQAVIEPPADVTKLDANEAVRQYEPDLVIGSWVTQLHQPGDEKGSMYGVDEEAILATGATYIHIGNDVTHGYKRIMSRPHDHLGFPWLVSRGQLQAGNHICVWTPR